MATSDGPTSAPSRTASTRVVAGPLPSAVVPPAQGRHDHQHHGPGDLDEDDVLVDQDQGRKAIPNPTSHSNNASSTRTSAIPSATRRTTPSRSGRRSTMKKSMAKGLAARRMAMANELLVRRRISSSHVTSTAPTAKATTRSAVPSTSDLVGAPNSNRRPSPSNP